MNLKKSRYVYIFNIYDDIVDVVVYARSERKAWEDAKKVLVEHLYHLGKCKLINEEPSTTTATSSTWKYTVYDNDPEHFDDKNDAVSTINEKRHGEVYA